MICCDRFFILLSHTPSPRINLPNPHYPLLCTITLSSLVKGEVLSPEKIRATTGGIASPPSFACTNPCFAPPHLPPLLKVRCCHQKNSGDYRRDCLTTIPRLHQPSQNRTIPCFAPPHLLPLSKVRCCRPKKFGRLPEGLSLHQPFQNRTIPLAFRNANICMHQYVFTSALSHENRQHPCLLMNALLVSHPCETLGVQLRASMPALEKRGEVLLHGQAEPTMVVIAPHPHHQ